MNRKAGVTDRWDEEADAVLLDVCRLADEVDAAGAGRDAPPGSTTTLAGKATGSPRTGASSDAGALQPARVA
jgi:hypothetical protein